MRMSGKVYFMVLISLWAGLPSLHAVDAAAIGDVDPCPGGLQVVVGDGQVELAVALARTGRFSTQIILPDATGLQAEREAVAKRKAEGQVSVVADNTGFAALPYVDNLLNRVVIPGSVIGTNRKAAAKEIARILAPLGHVYCDAAMGEALAAAGLEPCDAAGGLAAYRKPWPADIDEWTHWTHSANGNAVARDRKVGPPRHYQWFSEPRWMRTHEGASSTSAIVTSGGRIYTITDFAPASLFGTDFSAGEWYLTAQDAFNGQYLWRIPITEWGWAYWQKNWFMGRPGDFPLNLQKRLVAVGDKVYATLGFRAAISELDGRTGKVLKTFAGTEGSNEIIVKDNLLLASVLNVTTGGRYNDRPEGEKAGTGARIMAFDRKTGQKKWSTDKVYKGATRNYVNPKDKTLRYNLIEIDPATSIATDGKIVALSDGDNIVALDANSGKERWSVQRLDSFSDGAIRDKMRVVGDTPLAKVLRTKQQKEQAARRAAAKAGPIPEQWVGSVMVVDGVVLQANVSSLIAFDAESGKQLWENQKWWIHHLWFTWQDNFVIDGLVWTWGKNVVKPLDPPHGRSKSAVMPGTLNGYNLRTGKLEKSIDTKSIFQAGHHHRCYRNKATERFVIASHRGVEMLNLEDHSLHVDRWFRAMCHIGFIPANGLLTTPPHPCRCYLEEKLDYMSALAGESEASAPSPAVNASLRLTRGAAYGFQGASASGSDWPAFRHNNTRSGATPAVVGGRLKLAWTTKTGVKPTAPTAANGLLFFGDSKASVVTALKQESGETVWRFQTGGPVSSPPSYGAGKVYFGSQDGYVYCLKAATGELVWRFLAAMNNRQMCALGEFESVNPVVGSVMLAQDAVHVCAGRSSFIDGGLQLYALDPETGAVKRHNTITGPRTDFNTYDGSRGGLPQGRRAGVMLAEPDLPGFYMLGVPYSWELERRESPHGKGGHDTVIHPQNGFLDDAQFKRTHWNFAGGYANLVSYDDEDLYAFRMFDSVQALTSEVFFTPGTKGYTLQRYFRRDGKSEPGWQVRVPLRATAMLSTPKRIFLAGIPDKAPRSDPFAAFKGKFGAELYVFDLAAKGEQKQIVKLPAAPVFHGIAATPGRLFLTLEDGKTMMFSGE